MSYKPTQDKFEDHIGSIFGEETKNKILSTLADLNLPLPQMRIEYLQASSGALMVLDDYSCVVRIEMSDAKMDADSQQRGYRLRGRRVEHPLILQPLGMIDAGDATIEICPGTKTSASKEMSDDVKDILAEDGIDYWDDFAQNIGVLPIASEDFPDGVPVVIDRLSVERLGQAPKQIMKDFEETNFQQKLYKPLYQKFKDAVKMTSQKTRVDREGIKTFWAACAQLKKEYKMIPGWQFYEDRKNLPIKQREAITAGQEYKQRLQNKPPTR